MRLDSQEAAFWRAGKEREAIRAQYDTMYYSTESWINYVVISHNKVWFQCFTFMFTPSNCLRFFVFLRLVLKFASTKIQRLCQLGQFKQDQEASNSGKPLKSDALQPVFSESCGDSR